MDVYQEAEILQNKVLAARVFSDRCKGLLYLAGAFLGAALGLVTLASGG